MGSAIQLPERVHRRLETAAAQAGVSVQRFVELLLSRWVETNGHQPESPEHHANCVQALAGKYAHVETSAEEFINSKTEEIERENRRWRQ